MAKLELTRREHAQDPEPQGLRGHCDHAGQEEARVDLCRFRVGYRHRFRAFLCVELVAHGHRELHPAELKIPTLSSSFVVQA